MPGVVPAAISTPNSLRSEHEELRRELAAATNLRGRLGELARTVALVFHPHFLKEEEFVLPLRNALPALSAGKIPDHAEEIRALASRLESELDGMVGEHRAILAAVERLAETALEEGRTDLVEFATKLKIHATIEEQVLYPAAVLVGKYLECIARSNGLEEIAKRPRPRRTRSADGIPALSPADLHSTAG